MSRSLKRVLRVRALCEEICRVELEAGVERLRSLDRDAAGAREEARQSRRESFSSMAKVDDSAWLVEEAAWELASWRERRIRGLLPAQAAIVERSRAEFMVSRQEKLQVETLIEAQEERLRIEQGRREQRSLDEWFSGRRVRGGPGGKDPGY